MGTGRERPVPTGTSLVLSRARAERALGLPVARPIDAAPGCPGAQRPQFSHLALDGAPVEESHIKPCRYQRSSLMSIAVPLSVRCPQVRPGDDVMHLVIVSGSDANIELRLGCRPGRWTHEPRSRAVRGCVSEFLDLRHPVLRLWRGAGVAEPEDAGKAQRLVRACTTPADRKVAAGPPSPPWSPTRPARAGHDG